MASRFLLMLGVLQASNAFVLPQSSIQAPTALSGWFDKPVGGGGGSGAGRLDEEVGLLKMEMNDIFLLERFSNRLVFSVGKAARNSKNAQSPQG